MSRKGRYHTRQQDALLAYLRTVPGKHVTVGDVCGYFQDRGETIGKTTVYRRLERLVDEGVVKKYVIDGNSPACFEYAPEDAGSSAVCFHCKCESCGRLIHLHCDELAGLRAHLREEHRFRLNPLRTVLYGLCEDCARTDGEKE